MKKKLYIILASIIAFAFIVIGITYFDKKKKTTEAKEFLNESKQQDSITPSSSEIFNDLLNLTQNFNQFEGYAFVGELNGPCNMVFTKNSQGDDIALVRYAITAFYSGEVDKVDESYKITELGGKSALVEDYGVKNTSNYADSYLYGRVNGLKGSNNYGEIRNFSATGIIKIFLDTLDYKIKYVISSEESNWFYQGDIKLNPEQYIKIREFFYNLKTPEKELESEYQGIVSYFINNVRMGNKEKIAKMISYPLERENPIPQIRNEQDFLRRYDEIFDDSLKQLIIKSSPAYDWFAWGWRGIFFKSLPKGIKIRYDGYLEAIYYESKYEKKLKDILLAQEKNRIHPSLSIYFRPICVLETSEFRIRIDDLGDHKYRYASWPLNKSMLEKPDIVIDNGQRIMDGTGGNHYFLFKYLDYTYECHINYLGGGSGGVPEASLNINIGEKTILDQDAIER